MILLAVALPVAAATERSPEGGSRQIDPPNLEIDAGPPDVRRARRGLPRDLGALLRVAMATKPNERYVDAAALRADGGAMWPSRGPANMCSRSGAPGMGTG